MKANKKKSKTHRQGRATKPISSFPRGEGKHLPDTPLSAQAGCPQMDNGITILIAEDDPNDVMLLELAIRKNGIKSPVRVVRDGEEAVEHLEGKGIYADRQKFPLPSVI